MNLILFAISSLLVTFFLAEVFAHPSDQKYHPDSDPLVQQKLNRWQDLKFGLLMHWGPYSQWGVVESWSICAEDEPWCTRRNENYIEYKKEYENLKTTFNPVNFNPEKWALAAKDAGMRYVVFTTKHHDGFCMFDSKYTDYKITDNNCPFHKHPQADVTRAIFDSFRQKGFWIGTYFSKPDWHSEYYWWPNFATPDRNVNYDIKKHPARWQKFIEFTHNQILELLTDYGSIDILWMDGGWVQSLSQEEIQKLINSPDFTFTRIQNQDIKIAELVMKAREKQPGLIVVDRAVEGPFQNYLTPENQVPERRLPYPWESCIIAGGGWSYVPNAKFKSARELIHLLVDIVSKGGNLLLNIAPGPEGTWQEEAYQRLAEIGDWMKINSEAIYHSRPVAPYKEGKVCLTQQKDGSTYAVYLADKDEKNSPSKIWLSTIQPDKDSKITMLGAKEELIWEKVGKGFVVNIPKSIQMAPPCQSAWTLKFFVKR
jgi:alpha-L-fucosidase